MTEAKLLWLGHAFFKLSFKVDSVEKIIYIDPWLQNPKYPDSLKNADGEAPVPTDADLVLVTHGHFDHCASAVDIVKASTKDCKVATAYELCQFFVKAKGLPEG